jgi:hypothetical protein
LQRYLDANKDQTAGMAQGVSNKIEDSASSGTAGVTKAKSEFDSAATSGGAADASGVINQLKADPTKVNAQDYSSMVNATYGGPKTLAEIKGYGDAAGQVKIAETMANSWGDAGGRKTLLTEAFARPQYAKGMVGLDQALLSGDQAAVAKGQADSAKYGKLSSILGEAESKATETAKAKQQGYTDRALALTGARDEAIGGIKSALEGKLKTAQDARNWEYDKLGMLGNGMEQDGLNAWARQQGLDPSRFGTLNPLESGNLQKYVTKGANLQMADVTTSDDLARLQALQSLGGAGADFVTQSTQPIASPYSFNAEAYKRDLAAKTPPVQTVETKADGSKQEVNAQNNAATKAAVQAAEAEKIRQYQAEKARAKLLQMMRR